MGCCTDTSVYNCVPIETFILFASENGHSELMSHNLFEEIKKNKQNNIYFPNIKRFQLNQMKTKPEQDGYDLFDKSSIKICAIICSSTGNGDMPANGQAFFQMLTSKSNLLAEKETSNLFSHVYYTLLGLGCSDYSTYQGCPRSVDAKLAQLGAQKFYYRCEADEAWMR